MGIFDHLTIAINSLASNKFRTFLTTLGIIIGVMSVITLLGVGKSTQASIEGSFDSFGSNTIYAVPGQDGEGFSGPPGAFDSFTIKEIDLFYNYPKKYVSYVAGIAVSNFNVNYLDEEKFVSINGVYGDYAETQKIEVEIGRHINERDHDKVSRNVLIGPDLQEALFDESDPIGKEISINDYDFKVVGVFKKKGGSSFDNPNDDVMVPYSSYNKYISGEGKISIMTISAIDQTVVEEAKTESTTLLRKARGLSKTQENDFSVRDTGEILSTINQVTGIFTGFLSSIAAISLLVGGIGVMNIMFVSITERTKEIGLRKSLGATNMDILIQFLTESVVVTILGGAIGIVLGIFLSYFISKSLDLESKIYLDSIILGILFSLTLGLIFGIYPAMKASKLNPIDALRFE